MSARVSAIVLAAALAALGAPARAAGPVRILVLREQGVTAVTLAQPYLDRFVGLAAAQNGWSSAQGTYLTSRAAAEEFIRTQQPRYAILSLPAYLALRKSHRLDVLGRVTLTLSGGQRYHLISRSATGLAGCKKKPLATNHADDPRFVERVVARGQFKLADFEVRPTRRPLQTIRQVLDGQAACALVDDAQLAELSHMPGVDGVHSVWKSEELPPMVVTALPTAPAAEREAFRDNLPRLCTEEGKAICTEIGIVSLAVSDDRDYAAVVAAYGE